MMIELKVPVLPESITEATVLNWHKKIGDKITRDENIVDIETDKVVLEVSSPVNGILAEIKYNNGSLVSADQVIGIITQEELNINTVDNNDKISRSDPELYLKTITEQNFSPSVRRKLFENSIDPSKIINEKNNVNVGSGKNGRLVVDDLEKYISNPEIQKVEESKNDRYEERVKITRLRAKIAERLLASQQTTATLTTFNEVDMSHVIKLKNDYKIDFEKKHGVKLGFMSFFVHAAVEALKKFPAVNAYIDNDEIIYHGYCDIGIAVSTPRGLVVPILRNAEKMSYALIEKQIKIFSEKSQDGKIDLQDLSGGTFTISNGGVFGSLFATPILNPPQSAILGMHKIMDRVIVENNQMVIKPMMYLALSYDHRIIDGAESVQFLKTIKEILENPARVLLDI